MKISDLSDDDRKELKMELVDIQHFLFNMMISVGMNAEELYNYYISKNKENIRRQENNY
jgi:phosphoribosyl-ATP pyrophosphohydrolase